MIKHWTEALAQKGNLTKEDYLDISSAMTDDEWERLEAELEEETGKATRKPTKEQKERADHLINEELARATRLYKEVA